MGNKNENPFGISEFGYGVFCGIFISLLIRVLVSYLMS